MANIEVISKKAMDVLRNAPVDAAEQLQKLMASMSAIEQPKFVTKFGEQFGRLQEDVQKVVSSNLDLLRQNSTAQTASTQLDALRQSIGEGAENASKKPKSLWKETSLNPKNWSPEVRKNITAGAVGLGVAASALAMFQVGKWLFYGSKKHRESNADTGWKGLSGTKERVKQKVRGGTTNIVVIGALALATLAAFFGARKFVQYLDTVGAKTIAKTLEEFKKREKQLHDGIKKLTASKDALSTEGKKQLDRLKMELTQVRGEIVQWKKKATQQKEKTTTLTKKKREQFRRVAEDKRPDATRRSVTFALEKYTKSDKIGTVLGRIESAKWKMKDLLALYDPKSNTVREDHLAKQSDVLVPSTVTNLEDRKKYLDAASELVLLCGKHSALAKDADMSEQEFLAQSVSTYVQGMGSMEFLMGVTQKINSLRSFDFRKHFDSLRSVLVSGKEKKSVSPHELLVFAEMQSISDVTVADVRDEGSPSRDKLVTLQALLPELKQKHAKTTERLRILESYTKEQITAMTDEQYASHKKEHEEFTEQLPNLAKELANARAAAALLDTCDHHMPTGKQLLPFFHRVLPTEEWNSDDSKNIEVVDRYVANTKLGKALRWHGYFDLMAQKGDLHKQVSGLSGMQFEVLKYIDDKSPSLLGNWAKFKIKYKEALRNMLDDMQSDEYYDLLTEATGVSKDAVVEGSRYLKKPLLVALDQLKNSFFDHMLRLGEWYAVELKKDPAITLGATGVVSIFGFEFATRIPRWVIDWHLDRLDPYGAARILRYRRRIYNPLRYSLLGLNRYGADAFRREAADQLENLASQANKLRGERGRKAYTRLGKWLRDGAFSEHFHGQFVQPLEQELLVIESKISKMEGIDDCVRECKRLERVRVRVVTLIDEAKDFIDDDQLKPAREALMRHVRKLRDRPKGIIRLLGDGVEFMVVKPVLGAHADDMHRMLTRALQSGDFVQVESLLRDPLLMDEGIRKLAAEGHKASAELLRLRSAPEMEYLVNKSGIDDMIDDFVARLASAKHNGNMQAAEKVVVEASKKTRLLAKAAENGHSGAEGLLKIARSKAVSFHQIDDTVSSWKAWKKVEAAKPPPLRMGMRELAHVDAAKHVLGVRTLTRAQEQTVLRVAQYADDMSTEEIAKLMQQSFSESQWKKLVDTGACGENVRAMFVPAKQVPEVVQAATRAFTASEKMMFKGIALTKSQERAIVRILDSGNDLSGEEVVRLLNEAFSEKTWRTMLDGGLLGRHARSAVATVETAGKLAEHSEEYLALLAKIDAAKEANRQREFFDLVKNPLLRTAAEAGDEVAVELVQAARAAKRARALGVAGLTLGVLIDGFLIIHNEQEIKAARERGRMGEVSVREYRRKSLVAAAQGGIGLDIAMLTGGIGVGAGLTLAAPVVGATFYSEAIYDSVLEWEKTASDYTKEPGATLLQDISKKEIERTRGTAAANGDTTAQWLWKKAFWSRKEYDKYYQEKFEETETNINRPMREKIYSGYFQKYSFPGLTKKELQLPETKARSIFLQRQNDIISDKKNFVAMVTKSTFAEVTHANLGYADAYAELCALYRQKVVTGKPPELTFLSPDGRVAKMIDLRDFSLNGVPSDLSQIQRILRAVSQYRDEVQPMELHQKFALKIASIDTNEALPEAKKAQERVQLHATIRAEMLAQSVHAINRAEQIIRNASVGSERKDVARIVLREDFEKRINGYMTQLQSGVLSPDQSVKMLRDIRTGWYVNVTLYDIWRRSTSPIKIAATRRIPHRYGGTGIGSREFTTADARRSGIMMAQNAEAKRLGMPLSELLTSLIEPRKS